MSLPINPLLLTDSYKLGHADQYPEGTEFVYSNFTPRSTKYAQFLDEDKEIVFFGLQAVLKDMNKVWEEGFFSRPEDEVTKEFLDEIKFFVQPQTLYTMERRVRELHQYGKLPIQVNALEEGSIVKEKTPVFTIVNTKKEFYWLTNYLETWLSANLWKVMLSATIARQYRKIIHSYAKKTGIDKDENWKSFIDWQGHDFSMRGMSGVQDACFTGMGHLTSFLGTDTIAAVHYIREMYGKDVPEDYLIASSVAATEHSVMCVGSSQEGGEIGLFKHLIEDVYPSGIVSIVSDTWDYWRVVTEYTKELKDLILQREGKLVIRPDSGNPADIIAGIKIDYDWPEALKNYSLNSPTLISTMYQRVSESGRSKTFKLSDGVYQMNTDGSIGKIPQHIVDGSIQTLWNIFGGTTSIGEDGKDYKTLDSHIGLIYGDSITVQVCEDILKRLAEKGFSSANVVFGIGSFTYNYNSRDTLGFAMKATYAIVNGKGFNVYKDPKTDVGKLKKSAVGLLSVVKKNDEYLVKDHLEFVPDEIKEDYGLLDVDQGELIPVFKDGKLLKEQNIIEIREKLKLY